MINNNDVNIEINNILSNNKLEDLKRFLKSRKSFNYLNIYLIYLFHIVQSVGIFITTFAAGYNNVQLIWVGIGLNIVASLINIIEKINNSISQKILNDITSIKNNLYIDGGILVNPDEENQQISNTVQNNLLSNNIVKPH